MNKTVMMLMFGGMFLATDTAPAATDIKTVTVAADSRDYTLTVVSAHGSPLPSVGTNVYAWGATLTCSAPALVEQEIGWQASGWTGTGSVPLSGTKNTTGLIVLTNVNSSIAWNWVMQLSITNVVAAQRPGTKLVDITYDVSSTTTNQVWVSLTVSNGASTVNATNLTGHIGWPVATGTGRSIVWNMGTDWNGNVASDVVFTVNANIPDLGFDSTAVKWEGVNARWVKNIYANGDITMGDNNTGLMWLYNANYCGLMNWGTAISYCDNLTYAGHSDWRLPDIATLSEHYSQKNYFTGVQGGYGYWSSTSYSSNDAWDMSMFDGYTIYASKYFSNNVWPVRGGQ